MSVSEAFDEPVAGSSRARQLWEMRQRLGELAAERDELALEADELRSELITAYQRLAAGAVDAGVANALLRLVCDEARRIRLRAVQYAQQVEHDARSRTS
jgi:regulator of replication initiation timing